MFGWTLAASINPVAQSCPSRSTPCTVGIKTLRYDMPISKISKRVDDFQKSRWFSRGWTLQELIAPKEMIFFKSHWQRLGTRNDLAEFISVVTNVDWEAFLGFESRTYIRETSIAKRMAWAARRITTREEDLSYYLLGLFDVNMPLLYGEAGSRAFQRLQQEIIRKTLDHSFLVWIWHQFLGSWSLGDIDFLASHQRCFAGYESIAISGNSVFPFALTNQGLQIQLPVYREFGIKNDHIAILACVQEGAIVRRIGLRLEPVEGGKDTYVRGRQVTIHTVTTPDAQGTDLRDICIVRQLKSPRRKLWIRSPILQDDISRKASRLLWNREMLYCTADGFWRSYRSRREHIELPNDCLARQSTFGVTFTHPTPATDQFEPSDNVESVCKPFVRIDFSGLEGNGLLYVTKVSVHEYWDGRRDEVQDLAKVLKIPESDIPDSHHATASTGRTRKDILRCVPR